jgi:hypothetical protein
MISNIKKVELTFGRTGERMRVSNDPNIFQIKKNENCIIFNLEYEFLEKN